MLDHSMVKANPSYLDFLTTILPWSSTASLQNIRAQLIFETIGLPHVNDVCRWPLDAHMLFQQGMLGAFNTTKNN